jgi:hypothetical protein
MLAALMSLTGGSAARQERAVLAGALEAVSAAAESADVASSNEFARTALPKLLFHAARGGTAA